MLKLKLLVIVLLISPISLNADINYKYEYEKQVYANQILVDHINWQDKKIVTLENKVFKLETKEKERMLFRVPLTNDKGISKDYCLGSISMAVCIVLLKLATVL